MIFRRSQKVTVCLSASPSHYLLLNQWAEFNQTCYMTFPHGKDVQEQVCLAVHLSIHHTISNISTEHGDFAIAFHQLRSLVLSCYKSAERLPIFHALCQDTIITVLRIMWCFIGVVISSCNHDQQQNTKTYNSS